MKKILPPKISKIAFSAVLGAHSVQKKKKKKNDVLVKRAVLEIFIFAFDPNTLRTQAYVNNKNYFPVLQVDSISYKQEFLTPFLRLFFVS